MRRKKLEFILSIAVYMTAAVLSGMISILILNQQRKLTQEFLSENIFVDTFLPLVVAEALTMVLTLFDGRYRFQNTTFGRCLFRSFYSTLIFAGSLAGILLMQKNGITESRYFFVSTTVLHLVFLAILLYIVQKYTVRHFYNTRAASLVLLVTTGDRAAATSALLKTDWSRKISGIVLVSEDHNISFVDHVPVVAHATDFIQYVQRHAIDEVFIVVDDTDEPVITDAIRGFIQMGVAVHVNLPSIEHIDERLHLKDEKYVPKVERGISFFDNSLPLLSLSQPEKKMRWMLAKRLLDIVGAIVGMAITAILFVILGILIKIDSPGPIIFAQTRIGKNGRRFKMYKFRSMYQDAETRKNQLMQQNEMNGLMFKMKDDPRITRVGKFIRKTSLDEFPQFFNVLKGDMSLVGTRPPTEAEFQQYSIYHKRRLSMKPGITGLWQVSGRSDITDFEEVVRLDCKYIDEWSFSNDIKILWKTVATVIRHKGSE